MKGQTETTKVKNSIWKSIANAISMITVPIGAMDLTIQPANMYGWLLLGIGVVVQIAKYYLQE